MVFIVSELPNPPVISEHRPASAASREAREVREARAARELSEPRQRRHERMQLGIGGGLACIGRNLRLVHDDVMGFALEARERLVPPSLPDFWRRARNGTLPPDWPASFPPLRYDVAVPRFAVSDVAGAKRHLEDEG